MKQTARSVVMAIAFASFGTAAQAQTPPPLPTSYTLTVYSASGTVISSRDITVSQAPCTTAPPTSASTVNPTLWTWQALDCASQARVYSDAAYLAGLPDGSYSGTIRGIAAGLTGPESPSVPFSRARPVPPGAVILLRIIQ